MQQENILSILNRKEFRFWLERYHNNTTDCWILVKKGNPKKDEKIFWYLDAVEEALCFGWIDSTHKNIPNFGHIQRFSKRLKSSNWSELNKERCKRLKKLGLITKAGEKILPDLESGFVIDIEIQNLIDQDKELKSNFLSFPELYQKIRIDSIQREKNKPDIYSRMIRNFVKQTKQGKMYGQWNDYGRLINY